LKNYLQIEQVRFGDRLKIDFDVDTEALNAAVPSLILQPIVENAFRHGISKVETGALHIQGRRRGDTLELTVKDNGPGISGDHPGNGTGVGLSNTRQRLQMHYGSAHNLALANAPGGGLIVTITLPYKNATVQEKDASPAGRSHHAK
jgi:sensor histidine kinase YesM